MSYQRKILYKNNTTKMQLNPHPHILDLAISSVAVEPTERALLSIPELQRKQLFYCQIKVVVFCCVKQQPPQYDTYM